MFTNPYSSCGTFFRVREEHLVVARNVAGPLLADRCPILDQQQVAALRTRLGVPASSRVGELRPSREFTPAGSTQPTTLDDAVSNADAIAWTNSRASCVVGAGPVVEHAAIATQSWKGVAVGDSFRLQVFGLSDVQAPRFDFESELADATNRFWPPAEFLRRAGDI